MWTPPVWTPPVWTPPVWTPPVWTPPVWMPPVWMPPAWAGTAGPQQITATSPASKAGTADRKPPARPVARRPWSARRRAGRRGRIGHRCGAGSVRVMRLFRSRGSSGRGGG
ncbi:hypothetical protein FXF65_38010 [Actinomadura syzygii]|uniref:Uncharacterized protein n=1 Tax=Actinomadura syzygii TaxID=1427538 RepID=A0A5D0TTB5_9ACTN|nr:hypothetical protein FXF65_38010 [Actinomadura syzygii]